MDLEILKIASNTENHKIIHNHTHILKQKNPLCGDEMEIALKVKNNKIIDFGYQCKSCVYCQASVSLLSLKSIVTSNNVVPPKFSSITFIPLYISVLLLK